MFINAYSIVLSHALIFFINAYNIVLSHEKEFKHITRLRFDAMCAWNLTNPLQHGTSSWPFMA